MYRFKSIAFLTFMKPPSLGLSWLPVLSKAADETCSRLFFRVTWCPSKGPQGTKLGPWFFIIMIKELDIPSFELWKYVDDSTISETILKGQTSNIETAVDTFDLCAALDKFQLNETKCKEMKTCFSKESLELDLIVINDLSKLILYRTLRSWV